MKKVLIVGFGSIGQRHAKNLEKKCKLFFFDPYHPNPFNSPNISPISKFSDTLNLNADGVIICTPSNQHISIAKKYLSFKCPILIEKPISNKTKYVQSFLDQAQKQNSSILVSSNMRYHPGPDKIKNNLHRVGKVFFTNVIFGNFLPYMRTNKDYKKVYASKKKEGGGVLLDSIHEFDYIRWILGDFKIINIFGQRLSNLKIDVEDFANINLIHLKKNITNVQLDFLRVKKKRGIEIVGEKGVLRWQSEGKNPEKIIIEFFSKRDKKMKVIKKIDKYNPNKPYELMIDEFLKKIYKKDIKNSRLQTGNFALGTLKLVENMKKKISLKV